MSTVKIRIVKMEGKFYPQKRAWFRWKYFFKWSGPEVYGFPSEGEAKEFLHRWFSENMLVVQQQIVYL